MGALEILMETRARKEIADQQARQQQTNTLLDFALGQQKLEQDQSMLDVNQMLAQAQLQNAQTQSGLLQQFIGGGAMGGNVPPGTTLKAGPLTIPLNRKLTDAEQSAVAGAEKFEPLVSDIQGLIDKGVFKKEGFGRTYEQFLAEGGGDPLRRVLTPDNSDLETLASAAAEMKKFAFAEGGKQLSPTEKKVVEAGLSFVGKSNDAIKRDFASAIDILRQKKLLVTGGSDAIGKSTKKSSDSSSGSSSLKVGGKFQGKKILSVRRVS